MSLITLGEKKLKHVVGQHLDPIAIQAGKTMDIGYCECPLIKKALQKYGIGNANLPMGLVIATAKLVEYHWVPNQLNGH
ncbi:hypothetical protein [Lysinibacillus sp. F5]|uniref:hypothetical protein n=2 Tax=unclassified Lysinibacillus TaxID=2636778 RepID=UPI0018D202B5|nr:hypothetical protein [Lysinibacillus sp. F5]